MYIYVYTSTYIYIYIYSIPIRTPWPKVLFMSDCTYRVRVDDKFVTCFLTYGECSGSHFSESARHCLKNASDGWCQMLKLLRRTEKLIFFLLVSITFDAMRRLHVTSWKANICQYFSTHALKFFPTLCYITDSCSHIGSNSRGKSGRAGASLREDAAKMPCRPSALEPKMLQIQTQPSLYIFASIDLNLCVHILASIDLNLCMHIVPSIDLNLCVHTLASIAMNLWVHIVAGIDFNLCVYSLARIDLNLCVYKHSPLCTNTALSCYGMMSYEYA